MTTWLKSAGMWILAALAFVAVGAGTVWLWISRSQSKAKDNALLKSAEELAAAKRREEVDRVKDAGIAAEARVKEADAKAAKEIRDGLATGSLADDINALGGKR